MKAIVAAIHGILTRQTDPSWPDRFDAWLYQRDPEVRLLKKEYVAGPFPRWNCLVQDPWLAEDLANEIELIVAADRIGARTFQSAAAHYRIEASSPRSGGAKAIASDAEAEAGAQSRPACPGTESPASSGNSESFYPPIWLVAHSNGAVIALLVTKRLIARGCRIGGLILTGAACEADIANNRLLDWMRSGMLGAAIAYSSEDDHVVAGPPSGRAVWRRLCAWAWRQLIWPYGGLGRSGWLLDGEPFPQLGNHRVSQPPLVFTRWFRGGHGTYFAPGNEESTFDQIYSDMFQATLASSPGTKTLTRCAGERTPNRDLLKNL